MQLPAVPTPRSGKALIDATRAFAHDSAPTSWWHVGTTFTSLAGALAIAALAAPWPLRLAGSLVAALLMVRAFILFHDFMHGALLRGSTPGRVLMLAFGLFMLTPSRSWRDSHNFHHAQVGKITGSNVGSFRVMTTAMYQRAGWAERLGYRITRHPLTIASAYLTVFLLTITLAPLIRQPRRYWDSAIALAIHGALIGLCAWVGGFSMVAFVVLVPFLVAGALGAYLFYAQHTFPGVSFLAPERWSLDGAALASASYLRTGPVLEWLTGSIGFHHVHHLNSMIPFYRLREAMAALPELQHPVETTLRPRDILACLRLKVWDEARHTMVGYAEALRPTTPTLRR